MGKVSIVKTGSDIKKGLNDSLDLIGGLGKFIGHDNRVLIKPNLNGWPTSIGFTESLIQLILDFRVKEVFMAESTYGNSRITKHFFDELGYSALAEKYKIKLINLNASKAVEIKVKNPLLLKKIKIAEEVYEADSIINLPVMKVHYATGITLAQKNLKGLLVVDEKKHFHEEGLDKAIVDLNSIIKPSLNIIDGITCMEKMGPRGGELIGLNIIVAGKDSAEVDYVGSRIMGYGLDEVKHLKYYIEKYRVDLSRIEVCGLSIDEVKHPFKKVKMDDIIPEAFRIHDVNACSSCMNAFLISCRFLETAVKKKYDVYMGPLMGDKSSFGDLKIAFGTCCSKDIEYDIKIKGCPPYPFELKEIVK